VTDRRIPPDVADAIAATRQLAEARSVSIAALDGGLSNTNWLVDADGQRYVIRIAGHGAPPRARRTERAAAGAAAEAGIAPEIITFTSEGHSVVRFVEAAQPMTTDRFTSPDMLGRLADLLRRIHALAPIEGSSTPMSTSTPGS
jgi:aminoglycoside phosphotransferase (APT) family kinase protein